METLLKAWVLEQRSKGVCVDGNVLTARGNQLYDEVHPSPEPEHFVASCFKDKKQFKFSRGWLDNFLKRRQLVMRRISSTGRDLPLDTLNRINLYFREVCKFKNLISTVNVHLNYRFFQVNGKFKYIFLFSRSDFEYG